MFKVIGNRFMAYGEVPFLRLQATFALLHTIEETMMHCCIICAQAPRIPLMYATSRKKSIRQMNWERPTVAPIATAIVKRSRLCFLGASDAVVVYLLSL